MVCCMVVINAKNCAAITEDVTEANDCSMVEGTVVTNVTAGLAVTSETTVHGGTLGTIDETVVDILIVNTLKNVNGKKAPGFSTAVA